MAEGAPCFREPIEVCGLDVGGREFDPTVWEDDVADVVLDCELRAETEDESEFVLAWVRGGPLGILDVDAEGWW